MHDDKIMLGYFSEANDIAMHIYCSMLSNKGEQIKS
jgi:hypothetical protein